MWLPAHASNMALAAFLTLAQLQMANYVTDANVRVVAYFAAFLVALAGTLTLALFPIGLFAHRAELRRVRQRQAEAD